MKNITSINFKSLRNNEFRSIMNDCVQFAKVIAEDEVKSTIVAFEAAVNDFASFLETSVEESRERIASNLDSERISIYASCKRVAKALPNHPDNSIAEVGAQICRVFNKTLDPRGINQSQSTGVILGVIESLRNIDAVKLEACGFKVWMEKLETVNAEFMDADRIRNSERAKHELDHGKKLRKICIESYRVVAAYATAKAALGDSTCSDFIDHVNGVVVAKKVQLKIRKGRNIDKFQEQSNSSANVVKSTATEKNNAA